MLEPQVSELASLQCLIIQEVQDIGSLSWHGPQVKSNICWLLSQVFATIASAQREGRTDCTWRALWLDCCPGFSFHSLQSIFSHQTPQNIVKSPFSSQLELPIFNELCESCSQQRIPACSFHRATFSPIINRD